MKLFIQKHRKQIDYLIHLQLPQIRLNDRIRKQIILQDEYLSNWANSHIKET